MFKSLWVKFFVLLLTVSVLSMTASLYLRHMMLSDFRQYLEGEMLDRVYQVTAGLEGGFEQWSGWNHSAVGRDVIQALMMGMATRVLDSSGKELMNTDDAVMALGPLMRKRVLSQVDQDTRTMLEEPVSYPLFLGGERIGTLEVRLLHRERPGLFTERSNRFLLIAFLAMGSLAVIISLLISKGLTNPIKRLEAQTRAIREGDLSGRIDVAGTDEIGRLSRSFNEMTRELQVLEGLRKKVIANVAHELRTPISAMRGELEGMIDGLIPTGKEQMFSLLEEIERLTRMLDGIDDLTEAQASVKNLAPREIDLASFAGEILRRLEGTPAGREVRLLLEVDRGLRVWADPDRLGQILINLLSNALKATGPDGTITLSAYAGESGPVIQVIDTGKGITESDLPRIFERFYRGTSGGLGIGLPIVKELVEAHGGKISVESEVGEGTTVTVILPSGKET